MLRSARTNRDTNTPHTPSAKTSHSYLSHLAEDGADPLFLQQQAGHSWASTTAIYTHVGADAKNRMLQQALRIAFDAEEDWS
jgi:site-specific recombinase XerD